MNRRQLLQALGLGALTTALPRRARAEAPSRVVFFVQPHGHVPRSWMMPVEGPTDRVAARSLVGLPASQLSEVLRPLHAFRDRLLVVEGLAHTSVSSDLARVAREGGDDNNHALAVAGLLTAAYSLQRPNVPCTGGARSIDQELAKRIGANTPFASRVYGADYVPNQTVAPFSFVGAGQPTPVVYDPATALADLLGFAVPTSSSGLQTRQDKLRALRGSVLDSVAQEYELLAPKLPSSQRAKLDAHRELVRDLERTLALDVPAQCNLELGGTPDRVTSFMKIIRMALACDLTRVITYVAPVPLCPEFGYPADATVHVSYAHGSVAGSTSCGQTYSPEAERAMTDLSVWYARHFVELLDELDGVPEGSGTLLDHTTVIWLTELATPTHLHHDACTLVAGGTNGFFDMGRYVRYPRLMAGPHKSSPRVGPAQSQLFVSLLQAQGQSDATFGLETVTASDGTTLDLRGPLSALHRRA